MVTVKFVIKLLTIPYAVIKSVIEYYTVGTSLSRTNVEFTNSLSKNIQMAVLYHLSGHFQKEDVLFLLDHPMDHFFELYKNNPMAKGLRNYNKKLDKHAHWLVQNESEGQDKEDVIVYVHGGGYLLNIFDSQLITFLALYHALPEERRKRTSILMLDYSTSAHGHVFPTQLWEATNSYNNLMEQGYKNIHLIGDASGTHLICSLLRFIAYPEEAKKHFRKFSDFNFNYSNELVQPKSLILLSPWPEPFLVPEIAPGQDHFGDLGPTDNSMAKHFLGDNDRNSNENWISFNHLNFKDHWAKIDAIAQGNTMIIYGEREVLRESQERFCQNINGNGNITIHMEKGGIHSGFVFVESMNYAGNAGGQKAVDGDFEGRFQMNLVVDFLERF